MISVAITGAAGRMGRHLLDACQQSDEVRCTVAVEHPDHALIGADAGELAGVGRLNLPIAADDTAGSLHDKLADLGAQMIVKALDQLPLNAKPQPELGACYATKIEKSEAALDWRLPAAQLEKQIRAFNPFPGAVSDLESRAIKVWQAECVTACGTPGQIVAVDGSGIVVACGKDGLRLSELQKAGGKRLPVAQFLAGNPITPGSCFTLPTE